MKTIWLLDPAYWTAPWGKQNSLELSNTGFNHDHKPDTNIHTSLFACFFFPSIYCLSFLFFLMTEPVAKSFIPWINSVGTRHQNAFWKKRWRETILYLKYCVSFYVLMPFPRIETFRTFFFFLLYETRLFFTGFLVSKETVVLRRWGRLKQKFGFIERVDKCWITTVKDLESRRFER